MKKLIVNADDFGISEAANFGIIKGFKEGIVTSTTIMANMPAFDHAVALAKEHPELAVGIHLNLTCGKPLLQTHHTLTNENGCFKGQANLADYEEEEMVAELSAQIERALQSGLPIDHLDSHHHIHTTMELKNVIARLLTRYPYPMRGGFVYPIEKQDKSILLDQFYDKGVSIGNFAKLMQGLQENQVYDLMCHPAYIDQDLCNVTSYRMQRIEELAILCSQEVKEQLTKEQVELITYRYF